MNHPSSGQRINAQDEGLIDGSSSYHSNQSLYASDRRLPQARVVRSGHEEGPIHCHSISYSLPDRVVSRHVEENPYRKTANWYLSSFQTRYSQPNPSSPDDSGHLLDGGGRNEHTGGTTYHASPSLNYPRSTQVDSGISRLPSLFGRRTFAPVSTPSPTPTPQEATVIPALRFANNYSRDQSTASRHGHGCSSPDSSDSDSYRTAAVAPREQYHAIKQEQWVPQESAQTSEMRPTGKKKRNARFCKTLGCDKLVVDHGVCIRHGGGKRCNVDGCDCRAQNRGLCWKHGGYTICQVDACGKRAKSRGMCWSHGGGTRCKTPDCAKIAVSRGHCWAHGGGKRCKIPECQKPAALRLNNFCSEHHSQYCLNGQHELRRE